MAISAQSVTTTSAVVSAARDRKWIILQNLSDTDIYLKFDGSGTALTTSNGFKLAASTGQIMLTRGRYDLYNNAIYAIHGGTGTKSLQVQEDV